MRARIVALFAVVSLFSYPCAVPAARPTTAARAEDFEAAINRIERTDPGAPAQLSAQLAYADFLLSEVTGACAQRLERVQELLGSVDASPKGRVMFPDGWARVADLQYRLHLSLSTCGSEIERPQELHSALAAARRAVELYRNVFDYRSMVIMQFDAGIVLHELGENAAAIEALKAAIDMDKEYGFQDDAAENYQLLLTWSGSPAGPAQVAELMRDFPKRQTTLRFAWYSSDARVALETHRERLDGSQIVESHASARFERHIAPNDHGGGWLVSYAGRLTAYEPGVWSITAAQAPSTVFPPALLSPLGFRVSTSGAFDGVTDSEAFASEIATKTEALIRASAPASRQARTLTSAAVESVADALSPGMLEAVTMEDYQIESGMWIGATLDQGVWYEISAELSFPGEASIVVQNRIQFSFTRVVPCTPDAAPPNHCVELVLRATPDQESLRRALTDVNAQFQTRFAQFAASFEARIVTDPATLMPYAREERAYWYLSIGSRARDKELESEHRLSTTAYGAVPHVGDESR